ncbi:dienelactone hydrolase family protein [Futiania mangrovi]|uniref:Dienelactone hydrolase family protein n=1 Tax=Futiania mangrovi TaxID=2959716 RepID=A0A9J6PAJ1_9PROT|nr:dienelactone hydrolase family protein [Futiania mangrovii]MCP1335433.1 dienelactone hydrolase family protein [Futiania mangrovii]
MLDRRTVLKGAGALPLAAVLADPVLAAAVAGSLPEVTITTAGGRQVSAALALPATTPAPAVLLIHEWWGLNDQIKAVAAELANQGYVALAVDLMGGEVATTPEGARALTQAVKPAEATDTLVSWIGWLRSHEKTTGKVATMGWCFGGGWSFNASAATPVDGTVIYYGRVPGEVAAVSTVESPVLGHFATQDKFIDKQMVDAFAQAMEKAGKRLTVHWYEADHAFANPTGARYDEADAKLAWERTAAFLSETLR